MPSSGTTVPPPTTIPGGSVITIVGGPGATAHLVGPHNDGSDFFGIVVVLVAMLLAVGLTRVLFRRSGRGTTVEGPR